MSYLWWWISSLTFLVIESFYPSLFFLNLSIAALIVGIVACAGWVTYLWGQVLLWGVLSGICLAIILKIKGSNGPYSGTGVEGIYLGKKGKVTSQITPHEGYLTIYGEEWGARTQKGVIEVGAIVRLKRLEGLIFIVEEV